jgi:hypothetical protein
VRTCAERVFSNFDTQFDPSLLTDVAVVEMSDTYCQQSLFYHLGVRESFSMTNNIILYCHKQDSDLEALKVHPGHRESLKLLND